MPDRKQLQYKSMNDLHDKAKVDFKGKSACEVYKRLSKMREFADTAKRQGDPEKEYIMLKRWLICVEWLKKTPESRDDKLSHSLYTRLNQINEVKNILADLNRKLDAQYNQSVKANAIEKYRSEEPMDLDIDIKIGMDSDVFPMDGPLSLPETPTKDPMAGENEEYISCDQLYQILQKMDSRCLIIDIRPKHEFSDSKILTDICVNIPENEIKHGILASRFEKYLVKDEKSFNLFRRRGAQYVDILVLLDWNTTIKTYSSHCHLNILKEIFEKWDYGVAHKRIAVLEGGYQEWLTRYPVLTTNPNVTEPISNEIKSEILDDIEYPDLAHLHDEHTDTKTSKSKSNNMKPTNKDNILKNDISRAVPSIKASNFIKPTIMHPMEPEHVSRHSGIDVLNYNNDTTKLHHKRSTSITKQIDAPIKPTIDRSSKPNTAKSSSESKIVLNLMKELTDLAKNRKKLEEDILEHERSLLNQYGVTYTGLNDEEHIHGNVEALYITLEELQNSYTKVEEELSKYCKDMNAIKFNSSETNEKVNLDLNLSLLKRRIKTIAAERKKLTMRSAQNEWKDVSMKENENNIHKEPLKTDNSSIGGGLERSYSSPNLLQLGDRKIPRVDRSSKPSVISYNQNATNGYDNMKSSHISWANREERMTPIHGTVHPGITGLKNLGNSCYMNSIIQCLSNTTHLAKYFTDNLYADDLNTSNDSTTQGQVVEEVAQVIKALWRGQYKSISPHDLKVAVGQYKLQFDSYEQQDSHEFLTFLLDWMHNDLKKESKTSIEMSVAEKAWDKAMGSKRSIISDLFFGQLRSTITCSTCRQSSTTYETFNSLTTSLPHSNRCSLNDCIQKFVTGQKVVGWKCPKCQTPREATKKFDFVKLAPIIVIHLNRFAESGGWLEKRNTAVDFPLTDLNLKPYLVTDNNTPTISNIRNYSYSLYAMSNHYGTMDGGHYTAFCRNAVQNKWYKYDDQTVTEVSPSQVKSQNTSAYLLFYTSFSSNIS